MKQKIVVTLALSWLALAATASAQEWTVLFDGKSTDQLRGYKMEGFPDKGWKGVGDPIISSLERRRSPTTERERCFPRSLSDLAPTNSLCKTACTKMEAKSNENLISSQLVRLLEGHKGRCPGFHSKSAGGFAVSSLSDT